MKKEGLDALYLNRIENVRYSTDLRPVVSMWFQNSYSSVVTSRGTSSSSRSRGTTCTRSTTCRGSDDMRIMHALGKGGGGRGGLPRLQGLARSATTSSASRTVMSLEAASKGVELVNVGAKVADARAVKLDEEVALMQRGLEGHRGVDQGGARMPQEPGMREYEIAAEGEYAARKMGAEGMSWGLATFSGLNTGLMLRHDSDKIVRSGELLILGYATIFKGYNTDITTTTVIGKPSKGQRDIYTATYDSFRAALKATKPGATTLDIHEAAEKVIVERGYGAYSFSRIQPILHGVGMNVYEPPFSPEPGMKVPVREAQTGAHPGHRARHHALRQPQGRRMQDRRDAPRHRDGIQTDDRRKARDARSALRKLVLQTLKPSTSSML